MSGKTPEYKDLTGEQRRQIIDAQEAWRAWRALDGAKRRRFAGSMRWAERESGDYLLRKIGAAERSLGRRSPKTEKAYTAFMTGREQNSDRLKSMAARLDEMAPVNRAMGLGRIPATPARVLRVCDARALLGEQLFVVGTNALYAYEALAGVRFEGGVLATGDIDLLLDARRRLSVAAKSTLSEGGLIGTLQRADKSFAAERKGGYRAVNRDGYYVDFICPEAKGALTDARASALSDDENDLKAASIFGLDWLVNAPKIETVVIDERGYPAPIVAVDPRVFALYKSWLGAKSDRNPVKAVRDLAQARAVAAVASDYLRLRFDAPELSALPAPIRNASIDVATSDKPESETPNW